MASSSEPSELFKQGIKIRREVLGDAYVDKALAGVSKMAPDGCQGSCDPCKERQLTVDRALIHLENQDRSMSPKYVGLAGAVLGWKGSKDLCSISAS